MSFITKHGWLEVLIILCGYVDAHILLLALLDKKSLSIVTELHVQVDRLSIYLYVNLKELGTC